MPPKRSPAAAKTARKQRTRDQEEAFEWAKEHARSRTLKKAALPEAEGADLDQPAHPGLSGAPRRLRRKR